MDLLKNRKLFLPVIALFIISQVVAVTVPTKANSLDLFELLHWGYVLLGFFSLNWKHAIKVLALVTMPLAILLFVISIFIMAMNVVINGKLDGLMDLVKTFILLWGMLLFVSIPYFVCGFVARIGFLKLLSILLSILQRRKDS